MHKCKTPFIYQCICMLGRHVFYEILYMNNILYQITYICCAPICIIWSKYHFSFFFLAGGNHCYLVISNEKIHNNNISILKLSVDCRTVTEMLFIKLAQWFAYVSIIYFVGIFYFYFSFIIIFHLWCVCVCVSNLCIPAYFVYEVCFLLFYFYFTVKFIFIHYIYVSITQHNMYNNNIFLYLALTWPIQCRVKFYVAHMK